MLRTLFILRTYYHSPQTPIHIYFLSPKVRPGVQGALETKIAALVVVDPGLIARRERRLQRGPLFQPAVLGDRS